MFFLEQTLLIFAVILIPSFLISGFILMVQDKLRKRERKNV